MMPRFLHISSMAGPVGVSNRFPRVETACPACSADRPAKGQGEHVAVLSNNLPPLFGRPVRRLQLRVATGRLVSSCLHSAARWLVAFHDVDRRLR